MSGGAHEALEHAEHAAHAGHGHGSDNLGTKIGLTMAVLGVVLALSGALLGASRTEVIAALTNQDIAQTKFQGNAARFRTVRTQLAALTATTPSLEDEQAARESLATLEASTDPNVKAQAVAMRAVLHATEPSAVAMQRMIRITKKFRRERDAAGTWSDAYMPIVEDHFHAGEHYEMGQILAEMAIIIASIALLRKNKAAWYGSIALGVGAIAIAGYTKFESGHAIATHEAAMEKAQEKFFELKAKQNEKDDDDAAILAAVTRFPPSPGEKVDYEDETEHETAAAPGHSAVDHELPHDGHDAPAHH